MLPEDDDMGIPSDEDDDLEAEVKTETGFGCVVGKCHMVIKCIVWLWIPCIKEYHSSACSAVEPGLQRICWGVSAPHYPNEFTLLLQCWTIFQRWPTRSMTSWQVSCGKSSAKSALASEEVCQAIQPVCPCGAGCVCSRTAKNLGGKCWWACRI